MTANADALALLSGLILEDGKRWGDIAEPFQWDAVRAILDPAERPNRWESRPRGGSKTTDAAAWLIALLVAVLRPGSECYAYAADLDQARRVRDFLNGFLVLFEDQYVVGDYVTINAFSGSVELLTLRMVQIRDAAGDLITIPHSSVVSVVNQSRNWSRVDFRVPVDPASDVSKAIEIVRTEIEALVAAGDWTQGIKTPIEWIGIDALSKDGVIVRVSIKTAPLRQFELRRRINEQVRAAFAQAGVALGVPLPVP